MSQEVPKKFIFVVDTEDYAGNFEREMCALLTGAEDAYYHDWSEKVAEQTRKTCPKGLYTFIEAHLLIETDPVSNCNAPSITFLMPTPGWWNDGNGNCKKGTPPSGACPAYQSVGIKFDSQPPDDLIKFFKKQAMTFNSVYKNAYSFHKDIKITGFRLLEETTAVKISSKKI